MNEMWVPVVSILGLTALVVTPVIVNRIIKFKLEIARINAETTIKAEEIRAKNQLEIELLLNQEGQNRPARYQADEDYEESRARIKHRL